MIQGRLRILSWFYILVFSSLAFPESSTSSNIYIQRFIEFTNNSRVFGKSYSVDPFSIAVAPDPKGPHSKVTGIYSSNPLGESNLTLPNSPWVSHRSATSSRTALTPAASQQMQQAGVNAVAEIDQTFKENQNDPKEMGNLTLYRESAGRATKALWDHTLATLVQRKVYLATQLALSDAAPTCEEAAHTSAALALPDLAQRVQTCSNLINENWDTVNDISSEDPQVRDLRNQLQAMKNVGIDKEELKTNWNYQDSEFQTQHSDTLNNAEQLTEYNRALDRASDSFRNLQLMEPSIVFDPFSVAVKRINPGSTHAIDLNKPPESLYREFGVAPAPQTQPAETYKDLLQEHKN